MRNCASGNLEVPRGAIAPLRFDAAHRPGTTSLKLTLPWRAWRGRVRTVPHVAAVTYSPNTIFATISRWISDEPPKIV
jgi:hypothetical protein